MIPALVLAGCLVAFFGGSWLAARKAPILCDWCELFIASDEWDGHSARCVARHEGVVAGVPSAPATPEETQLVWIDGVGPCESLNLLDRMKARSEDDAALRTRLQQDDPEESA